MKQILSRLTSKNFLGLIAFASFVIAFGFLFIEGMVMGRPSEEIKPYMRILLYIALFSAIGILARIGYEILYKDET